MKPFTSKYERVNAQRWNGSSDEALSFQQDIPGAQYDGETIRWGSYTARPGDWIVYWDDRQQSRTAYPDDFFREHFDAV